MYVMTASRIDEAEATFEKAIELNAQDARFHAGLASIAQIRGESILFTAGS